MQDYYSIPAEEFSQHSSIEFHFVDTHKDLCREVARELVDMIKSNATSGEMTKVILPVGPLEYRAFAELCNREGVSCESLVVISMDEYCDANSKAIPPDHVLSFRAFYQRNLLDWLDSDKRLPPGQLIIPNSEDLGLVQRTIEKYGRIDVTYGGFGINGHFAFNSPPKEDVELDTFKNTSVRIVELREGDIIQMAMGGTGGNIEIIPSKACTLGMKELLSARKVHLTFMRSWHAGVLRRALFGPVTPQFPASLVQAHPNVKATVTSVAGRLPLLSMLQQPGK